MDSTHTNQSSYVIDSSSGAEMARLIDQDVMLTQAMGVFPTGLDLTNVTDILDIACGPGGWAREAIRQLPDSTIVGIDISADMISYANAFATVEQLHNLSFEVMDIAHPLKFDDASFDLVNARLLVAVMYKHVWPVLLQEMVRLIRPGGWIVLAETDKFITTNSEASEKIFAMGVDAMVRAGFYAGVTGNGITSCLPALLRDAGLTDIQTEDHVIDVSRRTTAYQPMVSNYKAGGKLIQPFLLKMGCASQQELDALYEQMLCDIESDDFRGRVNLTRAWGRKP